MNTYFITETQGMNDLRERVEIKAESLTKAKRAASRGQCFYGTWLHIEDEKGNHIARKNPSTNAWEATL